MAPERSCKATTVDGKPCGAPETMVDPETGYCPSHGPDASERLSAAGRKGGKATARRLSGGGLDPEELPPLEDHDAAETWTDTIGRAVAAGRISANAGNTALRAVREWRESREAGEVSERVQELERKLSKVKREGLEVVK